MSKFALIANVGKTDNWQNINQQSYTKFAALPLFKFGNVKDVSVNEFLKALKRLRLEPSEIAMDLLIIASTMYAADTRVEREKWAEDSWTRMIDLFIPVSDPLFWESQKELLRKIFRFLTGDIWSLNFRPRTDPQLLLSPRGTLSKYGMTYQTDTVCLFSGGMDSFIGAIDLLEDGTRPLLVSHSKSSDVTPFQENCYNALIQSYPQFIPARIYAMVRIPKKDLFGSEDHNERGRSFMFLTLGAISASALANSSRLIVPENGMISLNVPLTPLRTGSHSTRTTHPHYFSMMQELFINMRIGVTIENPYQFKTKGEMLSGCANNQLVVATETMSCSHPSGRWQGQANGHCGYCVPCIIRQASYKAAGLTDHYNYRTDIFAAQGLQIEHAEGRDIMAFKYMIEKINSKPIFLTATIRSTGPLGQDVDGYIDVYRRSLTEVQSLINNVILR